MVQGGVLGESIETEINTTGAFEEINSSKSNLAPNNKSRAWGETKVKIIISKTFKFIFFIFFIIFYLNCVNIFLVLNKRNSRSSRLPVNGKQTKEANRQPTLAEKTNTTSPTVISKSHTTPTTQYSESPIVLTPTSEPNNNKQPTDRQNKRRIFKRKIRQNNYQKEQENPSKGSNKVKRKNTTISTLKCTYTNATSLNPDKLNELSIIIAIEDPHVIFITETWFTSLSAPTIQNYNLFRNDRNSHGGGTAIYTRLDIKASEITNKTLRKKLTSIHTEQTWLNIDTGFEQIIISAIYRPTTNKEKLPQIDKEINKNIKAAARYTNKKNNHSLLVTGDFNFSNEIKWLEDGSHQVQTGETSPGQIFVDLLDNESLIQNVHFPTFQQANGTMVNTLDFIISDTPEQISELSATPPLGKTKQGHLCLTWNYHLAQPSNKSRTSSIKLAIKKGNYDQMNEEFKELNWDELFKDKSTDQCYTIFQDKYNSTCGKFIPKKSNQLRKLRAPWMNEEVKNILKKKRKLHYQQLSNQHQSNELSKKYHQTCQEADKLVRSTVKNFEENLANDKKNPKRLYQYIKSKQKINTNISTLLIDNKSITNGIEIANALNNQFQSVFEDDSNTAELPNFPKRTNASLSEISFTPEKILQYLKTLHPEKAQGNDNIHPFVVLKCAKSLAHPIFLIFKRSFDLGELPEVWLEANVTPIYKKGTRLNPANYRPISLTSILCKLMEKIIKDDLTNYLNKNNLINKQQHGFVNNKACNTNLLETMDILTKLQSQKKNVDLLLLDFSKAFDKVAHRRLFIKLEAYGISGKLLKWLKSFLSNRRQRVILGEHVSDWLAVLSGVIQGSTLGPLLFILYINDLPDSVNNHAKLFADDTKLIAEINKDNDLQNDINGVLDWTNTWLMRLNLDKCKVMHLGKRNPKINYTMKNYNNDLSTIIEKTESERDLGIQVSSNLKYNDQISIATSKANKMLGTLKRTFITRDKIIWKKLYTTYVRPHLEFAVGAWNPYLKKDINLIEKVQHRATKVSPAIQNLSYEQRLNTLKLTTLETRRIRGDLIQKYKIEKGLDIITWENPPLTAQPRADRRSQLRREKDANCAQRFNFFNNRIANIWNSLPDKTVNSDTLDQFKACIDKHL
jgi:gas vesicle protein